MHVSGIVAEYNPLHNGHVHHIEACRESCGSDYIIAVMSGDFVQRGEPAVIDKFTRAEWALMAGIDLVLELPCAYAVAGAERFARGAVSILAGTGVLDTLCFGSEIASAQDIEAAACLLHNEPEQYQSALKEHLALGKSYPRARFDALQACGAPAQLLRILRSPNAVLGMEYIRALQEFAPQAQAVPVMRKGAHDAYNQEGYQSASAIREALLRGESSLTLDMPAYSAASFAFSGAHTVTLEDAEQLALYALCRMTADEIGRLPDVQEGLENVLLRAARNCTTIEELLSAVKSKRYTLARCKRILLCALLGIDEALMKSIPPENGAYLRVLGFRKAARPLIAAIQKRCTLPLLIRAADIKTLAPAQRTLLELDIRAHDIYNLISRAGAPRDFAAPLITL